MPSAVVEVLEGAPAWMRVKHVAAALGLSIKTVYEAVLAGDTGKVPAPTFVYPYRWRRAELAKFIEASNATDHRREHERRRRKRTVQLATLAAAVLAL